MARTRVNEARYQANYLIARLAYASDPTLDIHKPLPAPTPAASAPTTGYWTERVTPHVIRSDRREYARSGRITITNNTTATLSFTLHDTNALSGGPSAVIALWGHTIALVGPDGVTLSLAHGYRTATTADRLHSILMQNTGLAFATRNGDRHHQGWDAYVWTLKGASHNESHVWLHNHPDAVRPRYKRALNTYDNTTSATVPTGTTELLVMPSDSTDQTVFIPTRYLSPDNQTKAA